MKSDLTTAVPVSKTTPLIQTNNLHFLAQNEQKRTQTQSPAFYTFFARFLFRVTYFGAFRPRSVLFGRVSLHGPHFTDPRSAAVCLCFVCPLVHMSSSGPLVCQPCHQKLSGAGDTHNSSVSIPVFRLKSVESESVQTATASGRFLQDKCVNVNRFI